VVEVARVYFHIHFIKKEKTKEAGSAGRRLTLAAGITGSVVVDSEVELGPNNQGRSRQLRCCCMRLQMQRVRRGSEERSRWRGRGRRRWGVGGAGR
jgi:hypothetical protein